MTPPMTSFRGGSPSSPCSPSLRCPCSLRQGLPTGGRKSPTAGSRIRTSSKASGGLFFARPQSHFRLFKNAPDHSGFVLWRRTAFVQFSVEARAESAASRGVGEVAFVQLSPGQIFLCARVLLFASSHALREASEVRRQRGRGRRSSIWPREDSPPYRQLRENICVSPQAVRGHRGLLSLSPPHPSDGAPR